MENLAIGNFDLEDSSAEIVEGLLVIPIRSATLSRRRGREIYAADIAAPLAASSITCAAVWRSHRAGFWRVGRADAVPQPMQFLISR